MQVGKKGSKDSKDSKEGGAGEEREKDQNQFDSITLSKGTDLV